MVWLSVCSSKNNLAESMSNVRRMAAALCSTSLPGLDVTGCRKRCDGIHESPVVKRRKGISSLYTKNRRYELKAPTQAGEVRAA